jgi:hypothetical protein
MKEGTYEKRQEHDREDEYDRQDPEGRRHAADPRIRLIIPQVGYVRIPESTWEC